jgi:UPF0755 protein
VGKREQRRAAWIVLGSSVAACSVAGWLFLRALTYPDRPAGGARKEVRLVVEKGMPLGAIARKLAAAGVLDHPLWFRLYATERKQAQKIRAGAYTFDSSMSPRQILDRLVEGVPAEEIAVTLPEGKNLLEMARLLDEAGVCDEGEVVRLARDPLFRKQLGVPGETLEGYLFPDTYRFAAGTPADKVLAHLVKRATKVLAELKALHPDGVKALAKAHKFGDHEIVLMASLVEKETAQPDERPRIAGVFLNRLKLPTFVPHLLQTDPTIVYGCTVPLKKSGACKQFEGRIRKIHLVDRDNPYNTYTHEGLPPGPIANPGRAALEAVLAPDATPFLYFVSKNDGTHHFSKTRAEHEAAVDRYQRNRAGSGT